MAPWKCFWDLLGVGSLDHTLRTPGLNYTFLESRDHCLGFLSSVPGSLVKYFYLNSSNVFTESTFPVKSQGKEPSGESGLNFLCRLPFPLISHGVRIHLNPLTQQALRCHWPLSTVSDDMADWLRIKIRRSERNSPFSVQWILGSLGGCWEKGARTVS